MHYTPPELLKGDRNAVSVQLDENGNPNYLLNPLLADLNGHVQVMDRAGIDAGVLSCGSGFDQPDLATCRLINDRLRQAVDDHPGRFIGLAHVPALKPEAAAELKRCAVDLGRMMGWEFSLIVATLRIINSGLLDELPDLKIQFSHFSGGVGRYLGRIRGFQQRDKWGTAAIPRHGRGPQQPLDHYLEQRLFYDCAGWAGPDHAAAWGAEWVRFGLQEVALSQTVFATDYPQAVRDAGEVAAYVEAVRALGPDARAMVGGIAAAALIPDLKQRIARRVSRVAFAHTQ
jgi:predicted TIM-barrel fold metal-dependent hydrolase